jgi:hypothetical protein
VLISTAGAPACSFGAALAEPAKLRAPQGARAGGAINLETISYAAPTELPIATVGRSPESAENHL